MDDRLESFSDHKYISLETYRKNGIGVKTPVWFVISDNLIHIITKESTGKVKRLKSNPMVKIAPCTFNGNIHGTWISGVANRVEGQLADKAISQRKKKYGFRALLSGLVTSLKGKSVVYSITLD